MLHSPSPIHPSDPLQNAELYRLLVDSIEDYAIFMLDATGHVASWNRGAQNLKGYKQKDIIGQHFSIFYTPEDIAIDKPAFELERASQIGRIEDEYWRVRQDGTQFWANVVITALHGENDELIGFAKVTRDLTERKRNEDILQSANEKLRRQQQELETLNGAKDEFIAIASHQLRTPATGVKQFLGLLMEGYAGELTDQQQEFVTRAYNTNARQISLVNDLLRVAQVDAGKVVLSKESTDICKIVREITEEVQNTIKSRKQTIDVTMPDEAHLTVDVDPSRFRMVMENLIDNASKYTRHGGKVSVVVEQGETMVTLRVIDTGVGIDTLSQAKLFTKFSRIPNELSDSVSGSGLGLYWVKKIVELHGGTIEVTSKAGTGSTFTVTVPRGTR